MRLKKIKREFIIIAFLIAVTVISIHFIIAAKSSIRDEIKDTLVDYLGYITEKDYDKMYDLIWKKDSDPISEEDFISRNSNIYEGIQVSSVELSDVTVKKSDKYQYQVTYHCVYETIAGEISFDNTVLIKQSKKNYKIVWDDSLIFPDLQEDYKVKIKHLKADRGEILDRNGKVLAGKGTASSVGIVPGKMEDREETIKEVAELLEIDEEKITKALAASWVKDDSFVPITEVESVSEDDYDAEADELLTSLLKVPGVMISETETRVYPGKECTSHLIGYVRQIDEEELAKHKGEGYNSNSVIGKSGLEATYEEELRAQDGYEIMIINEEGDTVKTLAKIKKKDGRDIKLTIDYDLQKMLYQEFMEDPGCSVAMNQYTGEILALVSTPSYDANEFIQGFSTESWNALNSDEDNPLLNRYKQVWCPGSSFKPIVASIGLDCDAIDPEEDYGAEGLSWQKDTTWGSYYVTTLHEYEPVVLQNALIYSDNIYFAKAALKIGTENMEKSLNALGFGEDIPVNLALSESSYSNSGKLETEIQLADTGYGQGQLLVNPVHLASLYTVFSNGGDVLQPTIEYDENTQGKVWIKDAFSQEAISTVLDGLIGVVNSGGTGSAAMSANYTLAGKTGTAELKNTKEEKDATEIGWFAVFTTDSSMDNPILLVSMVEDVSELGGSKYVVQKDKEVLDMYIGY